MDRPRFTVSGLLKGIVAIGLALAALRGSSTFWYVATIAAVMALLLSAIFGAVLLRGRDRAYWAGVAAFGGMLLVLIFPFVLGFHTPSRWSRSLDGLAQSLALWLRPYLGNQSLNRSWWLGYLGRILFLEGNILFAVFGGYVARGFAIRAESASREMPRREADQSTGRPTTGQGRGEPG